MEHFIFFFYILSFASGIASTNLALLLYIQYKKTVIRNYFWLLLAMTINMSSFTLLKYNEIVKPDITQIIENTAFCLNVAGAIIAVYILPFFFHSIIGVKISKFKYILFITINTIFTLTILLLIIDITGNKSLNRTLESILIDPVLIVYFIYGLCIIVANFNSIGERIVKNAVLTFFILTIIYIPILVIEEYRYAITAFREYELLELISLPLYFFIINMLSMVFSIRYYNQPAFLTDNSLSKYFINKYKITDREKEIIHHLINGFNNTEISKKLFISIKTVENHLSNIYSKVEVKNRVQLVNLVLSNR